MDSPFQLFFYLVNKQKVCRVLKILQPNKSYDPLIAAFHIVVPRKNQEDYSEKGEGKIEDGLRFFSLGFSN